MMSTTSTSITRKFANEGEISIGVQSYWRLEGEEIYNRILTFSGDEDALFAEVRNFYAIVGEDGKTVYPFGKITSAYEERDGKKIHLGKTYFDENFGQFKGQEKFFTFRTADVLS
eukprot:TRINITY_DN66866_c5_g2_i1.p1 TRINITY_DN66866_c5_g2~~TRINITY_DN66866_c5_g2_i1.p1  ORF type:complete len:115 (-),score=12.28 TRINITY_DN66866_c5_g2_i1:108-452(-)